ncbi:hypothetical protein [Haloprofundus sp. MHR1]|uniref:hypothetical protein n=1 Tax=Haloprofundus sp. MHR1 TaxID=2572921 RepID=UPI0010BEC793|nr:hypothetical protein [Haloprofundus sp. MHR1]QCJ47049.1 hypothetical protein FCF25_07960 [Haloprofundus sp. MHR1]
MPTDRDSPSADWRRVYAEMGVDADDEGAAEARLGDERIDAYAREADSEPDGDETAAPESENSPTRREGRA